MNFSDPVVEYRLQSDTPSDEKHYFFSLVDPRFAFVDDYVRLGIEKLVGRSVQRILVTSNRIIGLRDVPNYIVINSKLANSRHKHGILIPEHEELNEDFCSSIFIRKLLRELLSKQQNVFVHSFTTSFMRLEEKGVRFIGPSPDLATYFDSRVNQRDFLRSLDLPLPEDHVFENFAQLKDSFVRGRIPEFFVYAEYSSGGFESGPIRSPKDIKDFESRIRTTSLTKRFVAADIVEADASPNSTAIALDKDNVLVLSISDQLLHYYKYLGNIYPSALPRRLQQELVETTRSIGLELARRGYRGFYGCDFIVDRHMKWYVVDLNPRKQGGYLCNFLMFEKLKGPGSPSLAELELRSTIGESIDEDFCEYENPPIDFYWAHSKIPPKFKNAHITSELSYGAEDLPFRQIEATFIKSFFPKGSLFVGGSMVGAIVATDHDRDRLLLRLSLERDRAAELLTPPRRNRRFV